MKRVSAVLILGLALNVLVAEAGFDNLINKLNHRITGGRSGNTYSNHYAPQPTVSYHRQVHQRPSGVSHQYPGGSSSAASAAAAANGRGSGSASAAASAASQGGVSSGPSHYVHEAPTFYVPPVPVAPRMAGVAPHAPFFPSNSGSASSAAAAASSAAGGDLASAASSASAVNSGAPRFVSGTHFQPPAPHMPTFVPPSPPAHIVSPPLVHHHVPHPMPVHGGGSAASAASAAAAANGGAASAAAAAASGANGGHHGGIYETPIVGAHRVPHIPNVPHVGHVQPVHGGGASAASAAAAALGNGAAAASAAAVSGAGHSHLGDHHYVANAGAHVDGGLGERESSHYARSTLSNNGVQYGDAEDDHYYHAGSYGQADDENYYDNWNNDDENTVHTPNFYSTNKSKSSRVTSYNKGSRKSGSSVEAKDKSKNNYYHTNNSLQETVDQSHNRERDGVEDFADHSSSAAYDHHDGWNYDSNGGAGLSAYATDHAKAGGAAASGSASSAGPFGGSTASSSAALSH